MPETFASTEIDKSIGIWYDPVIIASGEGKITHANSAAFELIGVVILLACVSIGVMFLLRKKE